MRIAVLSDIHGNLVALEAVLAHLGSQAPDLVVNLGDCVTSPLWPRETLELLESLKFPTVRGNHDRWIAERDRSGLSGSMRFTHDALTAEQRHRLGTLPPTLEVAADVLAVHGTPQDDSEYLLEESIGERLCLCTSEKVAERLGSLRHTLVLCGHSHLQHAAWTLESRLVLNPGSVGCPRYADNARPYVNEAGSPHARYAIVDGREGRWSVQMHALDYDWSAVVERARRAGRSDWAAGFLKGSAAP
jgi:putative phosphoesterase